MNTAQESAQQLNDAVALKSKKMREAGLAMAAQYAKSTTYRESIDAFAKKLEPDNGDMYDVLHRHLELKVKSLLMEAIDKNQSPAENVANWIPTILNGYLDEECIDNLERIFDRFLGRLVARAESKRQIPESWSTETSKKIYRQILNSIHRTTMAPF